MNGSPVSAAKPVDGRPGLFWVAWHGGGTTTLRVGKRHLATADAIEKRAPRETLCGRAWRVSREVSPNDYWTTGDCQTCLRAASRIEGVNQ